VRSPLGLARSEWEIFQELSEAMGADMGFHSLNELHEEMGRLLGAAAEVGASRAGHSPPFPSAPGASPPPQASRDRDLVLFTYPLLVDEGALSKGSDLLKEALEEPAFVEVNTSDAERLGVTDGEPATIRTGVGEATLPVRVTPHIAAGTAFIPFNQPGFAANTILPGRLVTTATVEPVEAKVSA
jgi:NADH-quinone oxidoreductase subunit G